MHCNFTTLSSSECKTWRYSVIGGGDFLVHKGGVITPDGYFDVILQVFSENWGTVSGIEHSKIHFILPIPGLQWRLIELVKLGCLWQRLFLICSKLSVTNNPLTPFIKGEFFKSPLEKGDSEGCLVYHVTNFEFPIHRVRKSPLGRGLRRDGSTSLRRELRRTLTMHGTASWAFGVSSVERLSKDQSNDIRGG